MMMMMMRLFIPKRPSDLLPAPLYTSLNRSAFIFAAAEILASSKRINLKVNRALESKGYSEVMAALEGTVLCLSKLRSFIEFLSSYSCEHHTKHALPRLGLASKQGEYRIVSSLLIDNS